MKGRMDTDMGHIVIDREVMARYAGSAATECFGVVGMASVNVKDGVTKLLKKENLSRGVVVSIVDNKIRIQLHVIVAYGVSIRAVAQNILENVRGRMETFTGMKVDKISVIVEGVRVIDD
ncbi:MAG: Asp23/Gls24 family envelope stress response protein [Lachnospiraceae bacterium]|nr:Asp23/Gls24 family envelope stress response protein [Lachnospiraceae bacterium]